MIFDTIEQKNYHYYQSHLMPFKIDWHRRFDSFGNILAILTGVANKNKTKRIINFAKKNQVNTPLIKSLYPAIHKKEKD